MIDDPPIERAYINKVGIARYLGVSPVTVDRWRRKRAIPYLKIGGQIRFKITEGEEALRQAAMPARPSVVPRIRKMRKVYHHLRPVPTSPDKAA